MPLEKYLKKGRIIIWLMTRPFLRGVRGYSAAFKKRLPRTTLASTDAALF